MIPNFVNCDLYCACEDPPLRKQWAHNGEPILMHLSNFRPVKRVTDVVEIFALGARKNAGQAGDDRRWPRSRRRGIFRAQEKISRDVIFMGKQDRVQEKLGPPIYSCCRAIWSRLAWPRWKPWPAKSQ